MRDDINTSLHWMDSKFLNSTHIILFVALDFKWGLDPLQHSQVNFQASSISSMFLMCLLKVAQFIVKFALKATYFHHKEVKLIA